MIKGCTFICNLSSFQGKKKFEQFWQLEFAQKSRGPRDQLENGKLKFAQIFMEASSIVQSLLINQLSMQHRVVPRNTCFLTFSFRCLSNKDKEKVLRERQCLWKEDFEKVVKKHLCEFSVSFKYVVRH
jgi:hypothetical protein